MRRYWIDKKDLFGDQVNFTGDVFHHIFDVCRQEEGSKFEVLTEDSKAYFVEVTQVSKKAAVARIIEERDIPQLKTPHVHLVLSVSRFPVMDAVMEKAVEMGVKSIQPFFSEFSFVRSGEKISENKTERWDKIVKSATQQSGRGDLMKVHPVMNFDKLAGIINQNDSSVGLFAYEGPSTLSIKEYVSKAKQSHPAGISNIWIIVGSEGGFSHSEVQKFQDLGLHPVTLGPQVLRVETACMALVSVLKYDFDLMV
ncbi:16S rRNA (uracil(1498)-N(3))-methyltransferase [Bdellovibrio sp. SKB1291214]|uniref:RsmE family RNA methyltransferase n=1 Tax=Bdellovibrio sp. SKB1291214 TaxID=1732569 RepID=UPI000B51C8F5|nr:16S rRNA (uracil(1498)-N(3))-methyltransferase [Bdellovibrio sp. SKB1291214]UYL10013.1 16S rRNA (uracil(1498)-N(3))-methyltransferase [Bdellovibrio sp. SKB1291214]